MRKSIQQLKLLYTIITTEFTGFSIVLPFYREECMLVMDVGILGHNETYVELSNTKRMSII